MECSQHRFIIRVNILLVEDEDGLVTGSGKFSKIGRGKTEAIGEERENVL